VVHSSAGRGAIPIGHCSTTLPLHLEPPQAAAAQTQAQKAAGKEKRDALAAKKKADCKARLLRLKEEVRPPVLPDRAAPTPYFDAADESGEAAWENSVTASATTERKIIECLRLPH
jgi:hypothetical protein